MNATVDTARFSQNSDLYFTFKAEGDPDAELVVAGFAVHEAISELYLVDLALASRKADLDLTKMMDQGGTLTIHDRYSGKKRHYHGLVESAEKGDTGSRYTSYHITLRPSLHRLRFMSDCRIFQQQSYLDIVRTILQEWRTPPKPRPMVDGPQMAIVTGPPGEEIYCDADGRVKVYFPWDRYNKRDDRSSCWVRVSQNWAGTMFGHIAIPRIGQHVIVDYLEGDPDQPIITGRAYNAMNLTPNRLPDFKTRMIVQSKTHKGNGENILRFEDEMGQQELYLQAEKYMNIHVKDDETHETKGNRHRRVDKNESEDIGQNKDIKVGQNQRELIAMTKNLTVGLARQTMVGLADSLAVGLERSVAVGGQITETAGKSIRISSGENLHIKTGGSTYVEVGKNAVIKAAEVISLNVGGNFIRIDGSGIVIQGNVVHINSGVSAPEKGTEVTPLPPVPALPYDGPAATRYGRSYEK